MIAKRNTRQPKTKRQKAKVVKVGRAVHSRSQSRRRIMTPAKARRLRKAMVKVPPQVQETRQKVAEWFEKELPRATSGALLSTRFSW